MDGFRGVQSSLSCSKWGKAAPIFRTHCTHIKIPSITTYRGSTLQPADTREMELAKYKGRKNLSVIQKGESDFFLFIRRSLKYGQERRVQRMKEDVEKTLNRRIAERPPRQQKTILGRNSCNRIEKGRLRCKNIAVPYLY